MTPPLNRQSISPTGAAAVAAQPPAMGVLDPHRRTLFTQRLAVLIQRLRAASAHLAREDVPYED
jgi:hypothetical protein